MKKILFIALLLPLLSVAQVKPLVAIQGGINLTKFSGNGLEFESAFCKEATIFVGARYNNMAFKTGVGMLVKGSSADLISTDSKGEIVEVNRSHDYYRYVNIPVVFEYSFFKEENRFNAGAGVLVNFSIFNSEKWTFGKPIQWSGEEVKKVIFYYNEIAYKPGRLQIAPGVKFFGSYNINEHMQAQLDFHFYHDALPVAKDSKVRATYFGSSLTFAYLF